MSPAKEVQHMIRLDTDSGRTAFGLKPTVHTPDDPRAFDEDVSAHAGDKRAVVLTRLDHVADIDRDEYAPAAFSAETWVTIEEGA